MQITVDAPIKPGASLGGLTVGTPILELSKLLQSAHLTEAVLFRLISLFEASYVLENGAIEVVVDIRNGKVSRLTASHGYMGRLFGNVHVGLSVAAAQRIEPRLYYDEASELIVCRGVPGVVLEVAASDPAPEHVPSMDVHAISVYAPEVETRSGQRGEW